MNITTSYTLEDWQAFTGKEIFSLRITLDKIGYSLEKNQPHISGERYLMSRNKLVLYGRRNVDGLPVIIKTSNHPNGCKEIMSEKKSRDLLSYISFTKNIILFPPEIFFGKKDGRTLWITEYIAQDKVFVEHSDEEQFFLILKAFEIQESFHATTFEHFKSIASTFPVFFAREYFREFDTFITTGIADIGYGSTKIRMGEIADCFKRAKQILISNKEKLDMFSGYLTHTDFVPHNFRIRGYDLYMLDCSAVYFANKYEGWARFLNYMIIHNPRLEHILLTYLSANRSKSDLLNLKLMRIYKSSFLLNYYLRSLQRTSGDLCQLTQERIRLWYLILISFIDDMPIDTTLVSKYRDERDMLRSNEEKRRQQEFASA